MAFEACLVTPLAAVSRTIHFVFVAMLFGLSKGRNVSAESAVFYLSDVCVTVLYLFTVFAVSVVLVPSGVLCVFIVQLSCVYCVDV
jgi:hypothetical protein